MKTWKSSADPDYAAKKARVDQLYAIADRATEPAPGGVDAAVASAGAADVPGDPEVVFCMDEFGPLNLQPRPGHQCARRAGTTRGPGEPPRPRRRPRITVPAGCGTCSGRWTWPVTRCTGT
ncbi:MAG: hypothetical protein ACRDPY_17185 [Streptosporangiaceae bacterium]